MRNLSLILLLSFFSLFISAQVNLVPNASFEDTINCPLGPDDAAKCKFWSSYLNSPDYFNMCDNLYGASTPFNFAGYQIPKSGKAYMGVLTYYAQAQLPDFREYIGAKLTTTLTIGQKYFFSMNVVATKSALGPSNCYSSKLGVNFSKTSFTGTANPYPINNTAKIFSSAVQNDTVNWMRIKGSFISDSLYQYIIIGNFFNDNLTDTAIFTSDPECWAYYFVDDVCLSTDSSFAYNYVATQLPSFRGQYSSLSIYPCPAKEFIVIENTNKNDKYIIMNSFGKRIKEGICFEDKSIINLSEIENGIYFLLIKETVTKLIINH